MAAYMKAHMRILTPVALLCGALVTLGCWNQKTLCREGQNDTRRDDLRRFVYSSDALPKGVQLHQGKVDVETQPWWTTSPQLFRNRDTIDNLEGLLEIKPTSALADEAIAVEYDTPTGKRIFIFALSFQDEASATTARQQLNAKIERETGKPEPDPNLAVLQDRNVLAVMMHEHVDQLSWEAMKRLFLRRPDAKP